MLPTCEPRVFHMGTHVFHIKAHILYPFSQKCHKLSHVIHMYTTKFHSEIPCVTKFHMKYTYLRINSTEQELHVDACGKIGLIQLKIQG